MIINQSILIILPLMGRAREVDWNKALWSPLPFIHSHRGEGRFF
jgi:hypothetical protein